MLDRLSWRVRRWLADRLIGDHAYSKNLAYPAAATFVADLLHGTTGAQTAPITYQRTYQRNPGETA